MTVERLDLSDEDYLTFQGHTERDPNAPPSSVQAEEAVLGSVLKNPPSLRAVMDLLEPKDFYDSRHQCIYQAAIDLEKQGKPADYHMLADQLTINGHYEKAGGLLYLSGLSLATPSSAHIAYYAQVVIRTATMRRLISMAQGLAEAAYRDQKSPEALLVEMERRLAALGRRAGNNDGVLDMPEAVERYGTKLDAAIERIKTHDFSKPLLAGWSTGLGDLDGLLLGLKPADLIYLAARTSVGKSILVQQISLNVARAGGRVYFATLEMSVDKLMQRAITMLTGIPRDSLMLGNLTQEEVERKDKALEAMRGMPIRWDSKARTSDMIKLRAKRWREETGEPLACVVVDYVQLLEDKASQRSSRTEDLGYASRTLKSMAEDLECTVLAPVQVSREVLKRSNKMPDLSDLRESGNLEQDADVVLGLDRDDYHERNAEAGHVAKLQILKQRDSGEGRGRGSFCEMIWVSKYERYDNWAKEPGIVAQAAEIAPLHDDEIAAEGPEEPGIVW